MSKKVFCTFCSNDLITAFLAKRQDLTSTNVMWFQPWVIGVRKVIIIGSFLSVFIWICPWSDASKAKFYEGRRWKSWALEIAAKKWHSQYLFTFYGPMSFFAFKPNWLLTNIIQYPKGGGGLHWATKYVYGFRFFRETTTINQRNIISDCFLQKVYVCIPYRVSGGKV